MRKLLIVLVLLVVAFVGVGFYLQWFGFTTSRNPETGQTEVKLQIDNNKMKADAEKLKQKVGGGTARAQEKPDGK